MKGFFAVLLVSGALADLCPSAPEVVVLQDASRSLQKVISSIGKGMADQLGKWIEEFPGDVRLGVSTFTDKPIPMRGWGGRNFLNGEDFDGCYFRGSPLGGDINKFTEALKERVKNLLDGGDVAEAQYDAMISAVMDPEMGFSDPSLVYSANNEKIARILVMITDEIPHMPGAAKEGIDAYNGPNSDDPQGPLGFGGGACALAAACAPTTTKISFVELGDDFTRQSYAQMSNIYAKMREDPTYKPTEEEEEIIKAKTDVFGPGTWPSEVLPHPGASKFVDGYDCKYYEYPSIEQVKEVLDKHRVIPVVLVTTQPTNDILSDEAAEYCGLGTTGIAAQDKLDCFQKFYQEQFDKAGVQGYVSTFTNPAAAVEAVDAAVREAAGMNCNMPEPTTAVPTTAVLTTAVPTTAVPTTAVPTTAVPTTAVPTTVVPTTAAPTTAAPITEISTAAGQTTAAPITEISTAAGQTTAASITETTIISTTDGDDVIPADVPEGEKKKSNTAVIAGAAGGAVAGVAAVGGLLYKKFGASLFNRSPGVEAQNIAQVETPDNLVEREGMEDVTMDMFQ